MAIGTGKEHKQIFQSWMKHTSATKSLVNKMKDILEDNLQKKPEAKQRDVTVILMEMRELIATDHA